MKTRKPLPRQQKPIRRSTKAIRKVNPIAKAKRVVRYRKMLSGKEYKAAKAEALVRAGDRCEYTEACRVVGGRSGEMFGAMMGRCWETDALHAHHLSYPKTRPLEASDLKILCRKHHELAEAGKLYRARMW